MAASSANMPRVGEPAAEYVTVCVCGGGGVQWSPHVGILMTVFHFLWLAPFLSIHYLSYSLLSLPSPPLR